MRISDWSSDVCSSDLLSGYLRFGRDLPVVRFADKYNDVPSIVEAFAERSRPPRHIAPPPSLPSSSGTSEEASRSAKPEKNDAPARKRTGRRGPDVNAPALKLDHPAGASGKSRDNKNGGVSAAPVTPTDGSPDRPATPLEIIAPHWDRPLRQHGRPGGRRRPARPAGSIRGASEASPAISPAIIRSAIITPRAGTNPRSGAGKLRPGSGFRARSTAGRSRRCSPARSRSSNSGASATARFSIIRGGILRSTPRRSEEHTSELQSLMCISYAVFCL